MPVDDGAAAAGEERTLAALLERGHVEPPLLRRIVADVADQVAALHAAGSAHGAVHAETVLVRADGAATLLEAAVARGVRRPPPGPDRGEPPQPSQEDDLGALRGLLAADDGRVPLAATAAGLAELLREERPLAPAAPDHRFAAIGSPVLVGTAGLGLGAALIATAVAGASGPADQAGEAPAVGGTSSSAVPASTSSVPDDGSSAAAPRSSAGPRTAAARPLAAAPRTSSGGSAPTDADRAEPRRHRRSSASPSAGAASSTPTPTPTSSAAPDPTPTPDPPSTPSPTPTSTPTDAPEPTPAPTPTSSPEPTPTPTPSPTAEPTPTPTPTPTDEPSPAPSASATGEPTTGPTAAG